MLLKSKFCGRKHNSNRCEYKKLLKIVWKKDHIWNPG